MKDYTNNMHTRQGSWYSSCILNQCHPSSLYFTVTYSALLPRNKNELNTTQWCKRSNKNQFNPIQFKHELVLSKTQYNSMQFNIYCPKNFFKFVTNRGDKKKTQYNYIYKSRYLPVLHEHLTSPRFLRLVCIAPIMGCVQYRSS